MTVLWLELGYTMKYCLSPLEFPLGSGNISSYTPPLVTIQLQHTNKVCTISVSMLNNIIDPMLQSPIHPPYLPIPTLNDLKKVQVIFLYMKEMSMQAGSRCFRFIDFGKCAKLSTKKHEYLAIYWSSCLIFFLQNIIIVQELNQFDILKIIKRIIKNERFYHDLGILFM